MTTERLTKRYLTVDGKGMAFHERGEGRRGREVQPVQ
jgi:hypothetical protein